MADRFATSIEIGGKLSADRIDELVDAINNSDMSFEWGSPGVQVDEKFILTYSGLKTIYLVDDQRAWGNVADTECDLLSLGLTFKIIAEPKYEYPGSFTFYSPESGMVLLNCDGEGSPYITKEEIKSLLKLTKPSIVKRLKLYTKDYIVPNLEIVNG